VFWSTTQTRRKSPSGKVQGSDEAFRALMKVDMVARSSEGVEREGFVTQLHQARLVQGPNPRASLRVISTIRTGNFRKISNLYVEFRECI
jgi:hypothetical protein